MSCASLLAAGQRRIRYLTHPQVVIDPGVPVPHWPLTPEGQARVAALASAVTAAATAAATAAGTATGTASGALAGTRTVVSSDEVKAVETATPLAEALGAALVIRADMGENDRSATGFLPPAQFEAAADRFFARPDESFQGWETARAAQARIVAAWHAVRADHPSGDLLMVGHGGVGTLLYCALAGLEIDRAHDQKGGGGGSVFSFWDGQAPVQGWQPMERLYDPA